MKGNISILLLISTILLTTSTVSTAQTYLDKRVDYSYYSSAKLSDTLPILSSVEDADAYIYIYVDDYSCFTCLSFFNPLYNQLKSKYKVGYILFTNSNIEAIKQVAAQYEWKFRIVEDPIGAYKKLFKIQNAPVHYVLNKDGVIQDIGVMGKSENVLEETIKVIDRLHNAKAENNNKDFIELSRTKVIQGDTAIYVGKTRRAIYVPSIKSYVVISIPTRTMYMIDSVGKVFNQINFSRKTFDKFESYTPYLATGIKNEIEFLGMDSDRWAKKILYFYNLKTNQLRITPDLADTNSSAFWYGMAAHYVAPSSVIVMDLTPRERDFPLDPKVSRASIAMLDTMGKVIKYFGSYDEQFHQYHLLGFFRQHFTSDENGSIYAIQNLGNVIRKYSPKGELLDSIICSFDTKHWNPKWREAVAGLSKNSTIQDRERANASISRLHDLYTDPVTNQMYVVYFRVQSTSAGAKEIPYTLHPVQNDIEGKPIHDIALPTDSTPFHIENNVLYTTEVIDGNLFLVKYKLNS